MDKAFIVSRHRKMLLRRPNNALQGVLFGALCLRDGLVHGAKGVVVNRHKSTIGFFGCSVLFTQKIYIYINLLFLLVGLDTPLKEAAGG